MVHESCWQYDTKVKRWCNFSDLNLFISTYRGLQIKYRKFKYFFFYYYYFAAFRKSLQLCKRLSLTEHISTLAFFLFFFFFPGAV